MLEIPLNSIKRIEEIVNSSEDYISLSQGVLKIGGIPQLVKDYLADLLKTDVTDYYGSHFGLLPLREDIAAVLSKRFDTSISTNQVLITNGCIEGLSLLHLTLLTPGDEVILPEPTYPVYESLSLAARCTPVFVSMLKKTRENSVVWEMEIEKIKAATTIRTKMILFSNPWNPMGIVIPKKTLLELIKWCEEKEIYLVVDEVFRDYVFEGTFNSILPFISSSEWVICANSFSKSLGMSGWRIGYLVVPNRLMKSLAGMQSALLNCVNTPCQHAALFSLNYPEFTRQFCQTVKKRRDEALVLLEPLIDQGIIDLTIPSSGLFIFLRTQSPSSTDLCEKILMKAKVGLIPGRAFGPTGEPFIRLCYARNESLLKEGIQRLVAFFT